MNKSDLLTRREALKRMLAGTAGFVGACYGFSSCLDRKADATSPSTVADAGFPVMSRAPQGQSPVSLLGYGCMRFPTLPNSKDVDEQKTFELIDYAYKHGVNYYDTAYIYHRGESENIIGRALKRYDRSSYYLADKLPTWLCHSLEDGKRLFQEQLDRCEVDYFDYYLLHSLKVRADFEQNYLATGVWDYLKEERRRGRIRHLGFSFHGDIEFWDYLMKWHDEAAPEDKFEFVQIQLNYYDWDDKRNNSGKLYKDLEARGIPVVVMEPLRGGMLAKLNTGCVRRLADADPDATPASWAFRYVASMPAIMTVLSGMTRMDHLIDNVNTLSTKFKPLSDQEIQMLYDVIAEFKANRSIPCTSCEYCMPCPYGLNIPANFEVYNAAVEELELPDPRKSDMPGYEEKKRKFIANYSNRLTHLQRADHCVGCGKCKTVCPQHIDIPVKMHEIESLINGLQKH